MGVRWLGLGAFPAASLGSVPGWRTKIPQCLKKKVKQERAQLEEAEAPWGFLTPTHPCSALKMPPRDAEGLIKEGPSPSSGPRAPCCVPVTL